MMNIWSDSRGDWLATIGWSMSGVGDVDKGENGANPAAGRNLPWKRPRPR
jgi:hypothetical protein